VINTWLPRRWPNAAFACGEAEHDERGDSRPRDAKRTVARVVAGDERDDRLDAEVNGEEKKCAAMSPRRGAARSSPVP